MAIIHLLNDLLRPLIPDSALIAFFLFLTALFSARRSISCQFGRIGRGTWSLLAVVILATLWIRLTIPPHQHVIYVDEAQYMEAGKEMLRTGRQGELILSVGWPFVLRLAFALFGTSNWVAINTSILLGTLSVVPLFLLAYLATDRTDLALVAAVVLSLYPPHVRWSATAASNASSLFFMLLTLVFFMISYRTERTSVAWLAWMSIAFTTQFRPENHVLIVLFPLGRAILGSSGKRMLGSGHMVQGFIMLLLVLPNLAQVLEDNVYTNWIESDSDGRMTGSNWSLSNLFNNSRDYAPELFGGVYHPMIVSALAAIGVIGLTTRRRRESLFLMTGFVVLWLVYFTSWFQTLAGRDRFYMGLYPFIAIYAAAGAVHVADALSGLLTRSWTRWCALILASVLAVHIYIPYTMFGSMTYSQSTLALETRIPEQAEQELPPGCVIVANWPVILRSTTELEVVDLDEFIQLLPVQEELFGRTDCILFFEDYTCLDWKPYLAQRCELLRMMFNTEPYRSYVEGETRYTFHRITGRNIAVG
ncbi:MAG: glycosyltransferase family 39 protein [Candidatus Undinarchaeales archaeon]|nr:glycosyltransferase family 39 protein [Candidatus Undinarchaeales archaeon]